jgi:hypothetical protein
MAKISNNWNTKDFVIFLIDVKNLSERSALSVAYRCHSIERVFQIDLKKETRDILAYNKLMSKIEVYCHDKFGQSHSHNAGGRRVSIKKIAEFFWGATLVSSYPRKTYKN